MEGRDPPGASEGKSGERPVFLALGSNIEPEAHLRRGLEELTRRFPVVSVSPVYESEPVDAPGSPRFLNACVLILTDLPASELKYRHLRGVEARLGRTRTDDPNAPRTLDIDIALVGRRVLHDPDLGIEVPDPQILTRPHVALPLADLAPDFEHPVTGRTLREIAEPLRAARGIRVRPDLDLTARSSSLKP